jgi:hypothetical protein
LDEYKGPLTRSRSKQLQVLEIEERIFEEKKRYSRMGDREKICEERHKERRKEKKDMRRKM